MDIIDKILKKNWNEIGEEDLKLLYYERKLTEGQIAKLFQISSSKVSYKLKRYGINIQDKILNEALNSADKQCKKVTVGQIVFASDMLSEGIDELRYGPVKVIRGKHRGRIGYYDDDEGQSAYVYWGEMVSVLDTGVLIRKSYISNQITTYDLVKRGLFLKNTIGRLRCQQQYKEALIGTYKEITELYGEYVYVMGLLNKVYEETFYLQGDGDKNVFLSHSSVDKEIALYIASDLKKANYNVWFDRWDLKLGHSIPKEISKGLDAADVLLIVLSKDYLKSAFCNDEWEAYYMKYNTLKRPIILVIIDESDPPTILSARKYYRLTDMEYYSEMISDLKRVLSEQNNHL